MKILHVLLSPRAEGTPRLVLDWLSVSSIDQHILFLYNEPGELLKYFQSKSNRINIANIEKRGIIKHLFEIVSVRKLVKSINPDLVIAWPLSVSQWIHFGAFLGGCRNLISHAGNPPAYKGFKERYLFSYINFWPSRIMNVKIACCSNYIREAFHSVPGIPDKMFFSIYNCFNPDRFINKSEPEPNSARKVVMVATLESHKDHKTLLKAWKFIEQAKPDVELLLAGNGSLMESLKSLAMESGLKKIQFLGAVDNIPDLLWSVDLLVLSTTENEGFGTVLIEALAAGLPVIATDVPACREVLQGGKFGVLVTPDDPCSLAGAIINSLEKPLSSEQKKSNIDYTSSFTPDRMIREYLKIVKLS